MIAELAIFAFVALAALGLNAWLCVRLAQSLDKFGDVTMASARLNDLINARVKARIALINESRIPAPESPEEVEEIRTRIIDDAAEIAREMARKRGGAEWDKRDSTGIPRGRYAEQPPGPGEVEAS
jgi:hypothetical protein